MSSSPDTFHLWIGRDAKATGVALCELRMSGKAHVHRWGSITELTPGPPMTAKAADRRAILQLILISIGALYLCGAGSGAYWGLILLAAGVLGFAVLLASIKAARESVLVTPNLRAYPDIHRVLTTPEERRSFQELLSLAERVGRTLPALDGLVEPNQAAELLAQGLWDGAKSLTRKQEIRAVRDDLKRHAHEGSSDMSRTRLDLLDQQQRADALWSEVNADLDKLTTHLTDAAKAGEAFVRDRELDDTLQRTEKALAELSIDAVYAGSNASEQLADETTAVLNAYRGLNDLYGGKS